MYTHVGALHIEVDNRGRIAAANALSDLAITPRLDPKNVLDLREDKDVEWKEPRQRSATEKNQRWTESRHAYNGPDAVQQGRAHGRLHWSSPPNKAALSVYPRMPETIDIGYLDHECFRIASADTMSVLIAFGIDGPYRIEAILTVAAENCRPARLDLVFDVNGTVED